MKLLKARINWMEKYLNDPFLEILVDEFPKTKDLRFQKKGPLYYAEKNGFVRFFYYSAPGDGFGGNIFNIIMKNGKEEILEGPFSSSAEALNKFGFGPCVDVSITNDLNSYNRGYTFYSGSVSVDFIKKSKHLIDCGKEFKPKNIKFPIETKFTFYKQNSKYHPAVLFSGGMFVKNIVEEKLSIQDLSSDQLF